MAHYASWNKIYKSEKNVILGNKSLGDSRSKKDATHRFLFKKFRSKNSSSRNSFDENFESCLKISRHSFKTVNWLPLINQRSFLIHSLFIKPRFFTQISQSGIDLFLNKDHLILDHEPFLWTIFLNLTLLFIFRELLFRLILFCIKFSHWDRSSGNNRIKNVNLIRVFFHNFIESL